MGGEDSPSKQENESKDSPSKQENESKDSPSKQENESKTARDNGNQSRNKAHVSPGRSPLLQKLNRMHGDSVILVWFLFYWVHWHS